MAPVVCKLCPSADQTDSCSMCPVSSKQFEEGDHFGRVLQPEGCYLIIFEQYSFVYHLLFLQQFHRKLFDFQITNVELRNY